MERLVKQELLKDSKLGVMTKQIEVQFYKFNVF